MLDGARIFHVNVNCTRLERSLGFYRDALGLSAATHTAPGAPQPGTAFGLDHAQWDAWILTGARGFEGGAVDLLEWIEPRPVGAPPATGATSGFQRLGFSVSDLDATITRVVARGGTVTEPAHDVDLGGGHKIRVAHCADPDGVRVELFEAGTSSLSFVAVCCADLDASLAWYQALGFRELVRMDHDGVGGVAFGLDAPASISEVVLAPEGGGDVSLILVGFTHPPVRFEAARPANHVGIWRAALLVDDLDAVIGDLERAGIARISPPVEMAMGEGLPELRFACLRGPDREVLELIETLSVD
jgi:catechol 2,3-dioxygenase-like lactoylglutathione lyase family enzyme